MAQLSRAQESPLFYIRLRTLKYEKNGAARRTEYEPLRGGLGFLFSQQIMLRVLDKVKIPVLEISQTSTHCHGYLASLDPLTHSPPPLHTLERTHSTLAITRQHLI